MIGQQKNNRILLSPKLPFNRKTCNHFLKSRCVSELSRNFFKTASAEVLLFLHQSSRYVSNDQPCLKTTELYDDLLLLSSLFHFFYVISSAPISFSLCFSMSHLFFCCCSFSSLYQMQYKSFCILYINNMHNIYIFQKTYEFLPN